MEQFPTQILKHVYNTVEAARAFVGERRKDGLLHCRLREASETLKEIIKLGGANEQPFWYSLYDGMIGLYVQQKVDIRVLKEENRNLRTEIKELREKYMDLTAAPNKGIEIDQ